MSDKLRLGISACLLGEEVRYDGGHKRDRYVMDTLARYFDFQPVCPELLIGLGVPREPIRLQGPASSVRVKGVKNPEIDVTDKLRELGAGIGKDLGNIAGYILKSGSPSCGMERVRRYETSSGPPVKDGKGQYADALMRANPLLPVEEEGRLKDPVLKENFIERVFVYHDWISLLNNGCSMADLVSFHASHKYALMAHSPQRYRELGRLVANAAGASLDIILPQYGEGLMACLSIRANRKGNANVLQHLQGYLKNDITAADKAELEQLIHDYRRGQIPLIVPITLIRHFFRRFPNEYIAEQTFLNPHPPELMLRNLV